MNIFVFYCWRIQEELCKRFNIFCIHRTKYGLKTINIKLVRQEPRIIIDKTFEMTPSELFLGIDYLNDDYTLLDTSILDSPHIKFVDAILKGEDLSRTEYIDRCQKGTLDGRRGRPIIKDFTLFKSRCMAREMQLNDMQPVLIYQVKNRNYIYDGKHRAALCALKGTKVKCLLVDFRFMDNALFKVMKKENIYKKHLSLIS